MQPLAGIRTVLVLLLCVSATAANAQRFPFYNLTVENGLIQSQVTTITQDRFGHLWIGTLGGLSRYDGQSFTNYTVRDGMLHNMVSVVTTDKKGNLWIGGPQGVSQYDGRKFKHFIFQTPENPSANNVTDIEIAPDGKVWCLAAGKMYYVEKGKSIPITAPMEKAQFNSILPDGNGIWVAKAGNQLYRYANNTWDSLTIPMAAANAKLYVYSMYKDRKGTIWLTSNQGIYRMAGDSIAAVRTNVLLPYTLPPVICMSEANDGALWLGTASGAVRVTDTTVQYYNKRNGLCDNAINDIMTDAEGNIWMASDGQGLFRYSGSQFTSLDESMGLPSAQVMSVAAAPDGRMYLGTYDAGLYTYAGGVIGKMPLPFKGQPPAITALLVRNGDLWLGTRGAGLLKYNGAYRQYNPGGAVVTSLYADAQNRMWIGMDDGASIYANDSFERLPLKNTSVQAFIQTGNDSVLLATNDGIKIAFGGNVYSFETGAAPDSAFAQCFTLRGNELWIGTSDNGVICYNMKNKKCFVINKSNGLRSDFIYNIITDNDGNIWAGTGYGIHKIAVVNGRPLVTFYGKGNGVAGMESNHNAVLKMPDGSIWFGTTNGILHYTPGSNVIAARPISIVMQSVKIFGENITDTSYYDSTDAWYGIPYHLRLPYQKNNITFTFHAVSLSGAEHVQYRYRIEGLDAPWSDWANTNTVTFSAVPPGKYTFVVESRMADAAYKVTPLRYSFEIITPFHKTRWFKLLILAGCILLGVTIQYIVNRRRQNRLALLEKLRREEQSKVRERTAEDFHDEVGNKLTRINVLTNVLKQKIGEGRPDTNRLLTQIQDNAGQLYSGTRDILWSLKPTNDNLYEILHRIRDFGNELFQDTEIEFVFSGTDERWKDYRLPLDVSRNLIMIFKEALNNCLKYANATLVTLDVKLKQHEVLQLVLKDNGKGFDVENVKRGHGTDNMNVRARRINGRFYIDAEEGKGTIISLTFKIPLNRG